MVGNRPLHPTAFAANYAATLNRKIRKLLDHEVPLMHRLLTLGERRELAKQLLIEPMDDGRMGSFRIGEVVTDRKFGCAVAEVQFTDADGVLVTAVLNVDTEDRLFEVDIWKVNFASLQRWPGELEIVPVLSNPSLRRTTEPSAEF